MTLSTLSSEETAELQAEMHNVKCLTKRFPEAVSAALSVECDPEALPLDPLSGIYGMGWATEGDFPEGTQVVQVPDEASGFLMCKVYHRIPDRYARACTSQPKPGTYPRGGGWGLHTIFRMVDGSLVVAGNLGRPDQQIAPPRTER